MDYQLDADNCVTYYGADDDSAYLQERADKEATEYYDALDKREREFGPMANRVVRKMVKSLTDNDVSALIDALTDPDYKGRFIHELRMQAERR